jgi:hypothetical protein
MRFEILCKIWSFNSGMHSKHQSPGLCYLLVLPVDTKISEENAASAFKVKVADYIDKLWGGSIRWQRNNSWSDLMGIMDSKNWAYKKPVLKKRYFSSSHFMCSNPIGLDQVSFLSNHLWSPIASCLHIYHKTSLFDVQLEAGRSSVTLVSVDKPTWHCNTKDQNLNWNTSFKTKCMITSAAPHITPALMPLICYHNVNKVPN